MSEAALELAGVKRVYRQAGAELEILRGIDLTIRSGEIVALVGPSGSGKSTLLHAAGLLEKPDAGRIALFGAACENLGDEARTKLRRERMGFVYQYHHLLPEFSARENIAMPLIIAGQGKRAAFARADELLERMGLTARAAHRPARLSGGEQQRVAIARALAHRPGLLLADEPTGNLDPHTADGVFGLLIELVRGQGLAALIATHNPDLARRMDRTARLTDGRLASG